MATIIFWLFALCSSKKEAAITINMEDIADHYEGVFPCADCEGIRYDLVLDANGTLTETMLHQGESSNEIIHSGRWYLENDTTLRVELPDDEKYFFIHENGLELLNKKRNKIESELKEMYRLKKSGNDASDEQVENIMRNRMRAMSPAELDTETDFKARGNEPFWNLEIDFERYLIFTTMEGEEIRTDDLDINKAQDAPVSRIRGIIGNSSILVTIREQQCHDSMSDEVFRNIVRVEVMNEGNMDYEVYEGCGEFMPDYRLHDIWVLTNINNEELDKELLNNNETPVFEFYSEEERFLGNLGCNSVNGSFFVAEKGAIQFGLLTSTTNMCLNMDLEDKLSKILNNRRLKYRFEELNLFLEAYDGTKLTFRKVD